MNYEELLPRFESSTLWSKHKELYENSPSVIWLSLFLCYGRLTWSCYKGTCIVPKYNALVLFFLRFYGCDQVMDKVTVDDHHRQISLT